MKLEQRYLDLLSQCIPDQLLDPDKLLRFAALYERLNLTNEKINVTSITDPVGVTLKHFADSLSLGSVPEFLTAAKNGADVCDVGCGGGFPGLPLAIAFPHLRITMIDSTEKKIRALAENADALALSNVTPVSGRGENLAGFERDDRERFDAAFSRAVADLPVLCELCLPFVKPGGYFFALKGARAEEELAASRRAIETLGGSFVRLQPIRFSRPASPALGTGSRLPSRPGRRGRIPPAR